MIQHSLTSPHPHIFTRGDPPTSCLGSTHVVPNRHPYYSQSIYPKLSPTPCSFGQCESHSAVINGPSQHPNPSAATPLWSHNPPWILPTHTLLCTCVCMSLYFEAHVLINHNFVPRKSHYLGGSIKSSHARYSAESHARSLNTQTHGDAIVHSCIQWSCNPITTHFPVSELGITYASILPRIY